MAYGAQCDKLMRAANALTGLVIFIFTRQCRIPVFVMLAQMAIVCYVSEQRNAMTSLHLCTGSPEPIVTGQSVKYNLKGALDLIYASSAGSIEPEHCTGLPEPSPQYQKRIY